MYAILGEDESDAETVKEIVRQVIGQNIKIYTRGFGGCGELLKKGSGQIHFFRTAKSCEKFIICHDSDSDDPSVNHAKVTERIVKPTGLSDSCCIVIPVYMIEAWILANVESVTNVFRSWKPKPVSNPEKFPDPKGELERLSRTDRGSPRYSHKTHNQQVAKHLDLTIVEKKCPSFRPLAEFLRQS